MNIHKFSDQVSESSRTFAHLMQDVFDDDERTIEDWFNHFKLWFEARLSENKDED